MEKNIMQELVIYSLVMKGRLFKNNLYVMFFLPSFLYYEKGDWVYPNEKANKMKKDYEGGIFSLALKNDIFPYCICLGKRENVIGYSYNVEGCEEEIKKFYKILDKIEEEPEGVGL